MLLIPTYLVYTKYSKSSARSNSVQSRTKTRRDITGYTSCSNQVAVKRYRLKLRSNHHIAYTILVNCHGNNLSYS